MAKFARIQNGIAVDIASSDPAELFHPDLAVQFTACPDEVETGWRFADNKWTAPAAIATAEAPVEAKSTMVSPVEFKLLFTPQERIAIKAVRATDVVIDDFYDIAEDPRLTHVDLALQTTQMAIAYMVSLNLLTAERAAQILAGQAPA